PAVLAHGDLAVALRQESKLLLEVIDVHAVWIFAALMRQIGAPETALRTERVDQTSQGRSHVADWIGFAGKARHHRKLHRDVRIFREWRDDIDARADALVFRSAGGQSHVIDDQAQARIRARVAPDLVRRIR